MPLQPVTLGSEAKDVALVHDDEEHDQSLMLINKGMSPVGTSCGMLPKALAQSKGGRAAGSQWHPGRGD